MNNSSKKQKFGKVLCWILLAAVFIATMSIVLYNGFLNRYNVEKLEDYLYTAECSGYDYDLTGKILEAEIIKAGCSTVRKGSIMGRNLDWTYDDSCEFVVKTPAADGRYAAVAVSSLTGMTEKSVSKYRPSIYYRLLPFYSVDGINEHGLCVSINEVPSGDAGITTGTNPGGERLCTVIVVRYLLDYAANVDEAVEILKTKDLYSYTFEDGPYEVHFMISDPQKTVVVELVNNKVVVLENENIMTNYYLSVDGYTPHAEGIERYNILSGGYDSITDADSMRELLKQVYYTRLYDMDTDPAWYSEIYGEYFSPSGEEFTVNSNVDDFKEILDAERLFFQDRQRDGVSWQTCHTSVYDLERKTLSVSAQQHDTVYNFTVEPISEILQQKRANNELRKIIIPLEALSMLAMLMILFAMLFENAISDKKSRCFTWLVISTMVALFSDLGAWVYDGMAEHVGIQYFCNFIAVIITNFMVVIFIWYEYYYLMERKTVPRSTAVILSVYDGVITLAEMIMCFAGKMYYFIDGVYFPTGLYAFVTVASAINVIVIIYTVFHSRHILGVHDTIAFACYGIIPLVVTIYELFNPEMEIAFISVAVAVLLVYIMLQSGKTNTLKLRQDILEELIYIDQLTTLNNRRAYDEMLEKGSNSKSSGVIFCDVNGLKYANDHLGHKAGDALLTKFSNMLLDYFDRDNVFRISGDEFVVILRDATKAEFNEGLERFQKATLNNGDIASVGGAFSTVLPAASLVADAEKQMYKSKAEFYARHPEYDRRKR